MGFSVQLPIPGQPFSSEGVKVGNDLATIAQWGNGHILGSDLDPAAGIHAAQLDVDAQAPVGIVLPFSGKASTPTGYAICDGRTLTRNNFPRGFDFATAEVAAGNPLWTVNAGAATFTVPDLRDRFIWSSSTAALGVTGGEQNHLLSAAESGVNGNGVTGTDTPDHSHAMAWQLFASSCTVGPAGFYSVTGGSTATGGASARHGHPLVARNADQAHNNMPPYVVLSLIVRVL